MLERSRAFRYVTLAQRIEALRGASIRIARDHSGDEVVPLIKYFAKVSRMSKR